MQVSVRCSLRLQGYSSSLQQCQSRTRARPWRQPPNPYPARSRTPAYTTSCLPILPKPPRTYKGVTYPGGEPGEASLAPPVGWMAPPSLDTSSTEKTVVSEGSATADAEPVPEAGGGNTGGVAGGSAGGSGGGGGGGSGGAGDANSKGGQSGGDNGGDGPLDRWAVFTRLCRVAALTWALCTAAHSIWIVHTYQLWDHLLGPDRNRESVRAYVHQRFTNAAFVEAGGAAAAIGAAVCSGWLLTSSLLGVQAVTAFQAGQVAVGLQAAMLLGALGARRDAERKRRDAALQAEVQQLRRALQWLAA